MTPQQPLNDRVRDLIRRMSERRKLSMITATRDTRGELAERHSARGTINSGAFVTDVTKAFGKAFYNYTIGIRDDALHVSRQSLGALTPPLVAELKPMLEECFDAAAVTLRGEINSARMPELRDSVNRLLDNALHEAKRDLAIELDMASLNAGTKAAAPVDEALMDSLVDLQNRRGFETQFSSVIQEEDQRHCLVLFDIDHFKDVNDKNGGHAVGDQALKSIADAAAACVRGKGKAFRWGGDEFVLLLPNHTLDEGLAVAERFRREVNSAPRTSQALTLSVSVGVAEWPTHGRDLNELHAAADKALYDSKNRGRNVVRYFGEPEPSSSTAERPQSRKQPTPDELTEEEGQRIRSQYFRTRMARCPRDEALLDVQSTATFGRTTPSLYVSCPLCGLSAELD